MWCCLLPLVPVALFGMWAWSERLRQLLGLVTALGLPPALAIAAIRLGSALATCDTLDDSTLIARECGATGSILRDGQRVDTPIEMRRRPFSVRVVEPAGWPLPPRLSREHFRPVETDQGIPEGDAAERERLGATFQVGLWPLGEHTLGVYGLDPYEMDGRVVFVALQGEVVDEVDVESTRSLPPALQLATEVAWWAVTSDTLVLHTERDGGTLELRADDLSLRASASGLGRLLDAREGLLDDGAGGVFVVADPAVTNAGEARDPSVPITVFHVRADGTTTRSDVLLPAQYWGGLSAAQGGGLCLSGDRTVHLTGDPPALARWEAALVLSDRWPQIVAFLIALLSMSMALAVLVPRLRAWAGVARGVEGELRRVEGVLRWVERDGIERTIAHVGAWVGLDEKDPRAGPAVAMAPVLEGGAGEPYREGRAPVRMRALIGGTRAEARAQMLRPVIDLLPMVGVGLTLVALPAIAFLLATV